MLKRVSSHPYYVQKVNEAMLCKMWGCRPSEMREELAEDVAAHSIIYWLMIQENPFF